MSEKDLIIPEQILPTNLFILPVGPNPVFPGLLTHLMFTDDQDKKIVDQAIKHGGNIGLILSKTIDEDATYNEENLYKTGTVAKIVKKIKLPDGGIHLFISTVKRFTVDKYLESGEFTIAEISYVEDKPYEVEDLTPWTRQLYFEVKNLSESDPMLSEQLKLNMVNIQDPGKLSDFLASSLEMEGSEQQELLECLDVRERIEKLLVFIKNEQEISKIQKSILNKVNKKVEKNQRDYFLRQELKTIQNELGTTTDPRKQVIDKLRSQIKEIFKFFPKEVQEKVVDEMNKLASIEMASPEFNISRSYLDNIVKLPWAPSKKRDYSITSARKVLNRDHYGMKDVKDRILEFLAVRELADSDKGAIICLVGAPGVGKTSIGKSVAAALKKEYFRFSVGGMKDESEIKGHRRTYVGAIPGKIVKGLQVCKTNNPLFMIDEIDKMGQSYQGDPASALLEVLDPEQNTNFRDNYLDLPFDLSHVLFIATANSVGGIPEPLLDRMELIEVGGYTSDEKVQIGKKYLVPKSLKANGLTKNDIKFTPTILKKIAEEYSREAGVRNFEKNIKKIERKVAVKILEDETIEKPVKINNQMLNEFLGIPYFTEETKIVANKPGMAVGLAWTSMGGDTLAIESQASKGTGKLKLTGQLGDVMQESVNIAYTYLKCHCNELRIDYNWFDTHDVHLHVPEGAIKKDGPSAGITMTTALFSLITNQVMKANTAMTGEITLMGKVMPIGGLKEKVLAAQRNKNTMIIIPKENKRDLDKLDSTVTKGIEFHTVEDVSEVLKLVFPDDDKSVRPVVEKDEKRKHEQLEVITAAVSTAVKEALNG
ncbi:MAG: endopeptidase La [Sphaerochaetaceae bacterium]|nr:endopeptidase La [Sphaerochaetaceae bacterium]